MFFGEPKVVCCYFKISFPQNSTLSLKQHTEKNPPKVVHGTLILNLNPRMWAVAFALKWYLHFLHILLPEEE